MCKTVNLLLMEQKHGVMFLEGMFIVVCSPLMSVLKS